MDSGTLLDYALFQLTPTRTRCELVIYGSSGESEKLASGLLQPFLSHLRSAQDQISKGGYSIRLRPPSTASWFTKSTLQRFVRFVSTPEVLERLVTIEREIGQIQTSVQSHETSNSLDSVEAEGIVSAAEGTHTVLHASAKSKAEGNGNAITKVEETSKVRLQRVLETRKAVLRKEQAMAYARALVAGFNIEYMEDLISFAEAFGAPRLREACINFTDLCKRENEDGLWMDELAAMQQACAQAEYSLGTSGNVLASEDSDLGHSITINLRNDGASVKKQNNDSTMSYGSLEASQDRRSSPAAQTPPVDDKSEVPMSWPNHLPPHMQSFQGPVFQQIPPYQGFAFPGMQVPPLYYPTNMQWPPSREDYTLALDKEHTDHRRLSSKNDKRNLYKNGLENSEEGTKTQSGSNSESGSDESLQHSIKHSLGRLQIKRNAKRSSRKVVIRNINYITSGRDSERDGTSEDNSSDLDKLSVGDSLIKCAEDVNSLKRRSRTTSHHNRRDEGKRLSNGNDSNDYAHHDREKTVANDTKEPINGSWDALQNLLMIGRDTHESNMKPSSLQFEDSCNARALEGMSISPEKEMQNQINVSLDAFIVTPRETGSDGDTPMYMGMEENIQPIMKNMENKYEDFLISRRAEESQNQSGDYLSNSAFESSIIKCTTGDWFPDKEPNAAADLNESNNFERLVEDDALALPGDGHHTIKGNNVVLVDDSFMIQARSVVNDEANSQLVTDISMVTEIVDPSQTKGSNKEMLGSQISLQQEPDDLCIVLERNFSREHSITPWTPEMDYANEISPTEVNKGQQDGEIAKWVASDHIFSGKAVKGVDSGDLKKKVSSREGRSLSQVGSTRKGSLEMLSRSKHPYSGGKMTATKSKQMEEEKRRKVEELRVQRQKRIAERSLIAGSTPAISKKNQTVIASMSAKTLHKHPTPEVKELPKPVFKSSTIDRLSAARNNHEISSSQQKSGQPKKTSLKAKNLTNSSLEKSPRPENNRSSVQQEVKPTDVNIRPKRSNGSFPSNSNNETGKDQVGVTATPPIEQASVCSGMGTDHEPMHPRKKWNDGEVSPKATKGIRKMLLFDQRSHNSLVS